jgi:plastocyanin
MPARTRFLIALTAIAGLSFTAIGVVSQKEAHATPAFNVEQAKPTITISLNSSGDPAYLYNPAQLQAKAGQPITVTNEDPNGVHSVTAQDRSFSIDVPPKTSVTLTVSKAGTYPYFCTYHSDQHNKASLTIS